MMRKKIEGMGKNLNSLIKDVKRTKAAGRRKRIKIEIKRGELNKSRR